MAVAGCCEDTTDVKVGDVRQHYVGVLVWQALEQRAAKHLHNALKRSAERAQARADPDACRSASPPPLFTHKLA